MQLVDSTKECEWCYSPQTTRIVSVDGDVFYVCDRHAKECDPAQQVTNNEEA